MLNYQSVRSSEPQIRSNPALKQLGSKSGFQAKLVSLLESTPLPFPTFQLVKEASQQFLKTQQLYAWIRPSHLRSQWLVLADGLPALLYDPRHTDRLSALRISFDKKQVQQLGPIVCEVAWDAQDHIVWIFDIAIWEKQVVWGHMPYSKRWSLLKTLTGSILDHNHPMSDAEIKLPTWMSLQTLATYESIDPAMSIEFQPEKAGLRRHLLLLKDDGIKFKPTSHHERKMVHEVKPKYAKESKGCAIVLEEPDRIKNPIIQTKPIVLQPVEPRSESQKPTTRETVCKLFKDKVSRGPDTYRLVSNTGESLGLASIRSLSLSTALRDALAVTDTLTVAIQWYEPFQKYEVKRIM